MVAAVPSAPEKVTVWFTATPRVFTCRLRSLLNPTGRFTRATVPVSSPAYPVGRTRMTPLPLLSRSPTSSLSSPAAPASPRNRLTSLKPSRTTLVPAAVRVCSNSTTPERLCPKRVIRAGSEGRPTCTRRVPAGTARVAATPPMLSSVFTAAAVVFTCSTTVAARLKSFDRVSFSASEATSEPARPVRVMSRAPEAVTVAKVVAPSPRARRASATTRLIAPEAVFFAKPTLPTSRCPPISRTIPVPATAMPGARSVPPTVTVRARPLNATLKLPPKVTPGTSIVTVALTVPATPPGSPGRAPITASVPEPPETTTTSRPAAVSRSERLLNPTVRSKVGVAGSEPSAASTARRSKARSVRNDCPPIARASPVTVTLR